MSLPVGFQLGAEITERSPIKDVLVSSAQALCSLAREVHKSGSNLVVEADLANYLGRSTVRKALVEKFKEVVNKKQPFQVLVADSEIELKSGPGPTVVNAIHLPQFMSSIIQLSFLAYLHPRNELASAISTAVQRRIELGIREHNEDPGQEAIEATLATINSQTGQLNWSDLVERVNKDLMATVPQYRYQTDYSTVTPNLMRAGLDLFCLLQKLPKDRHMVVSTNTGCVALIAWAYHILGIGVAIVSALDHKVLFKTSDSVNITIVWPVTLPDFGLGSYHSGVSDEEPEIRYLDAEGNILVKLEADPNRRQPIGATDRHPLRGWATSFLHRWLNTRLLTSENDPVFLATAHLSCAVALRASRYLRTPACPSPFQEPDWSDIYLEEWRIMNSARLLFTGLMLDEKAIRAQLQRPGGLDESNVPGAFDQLIKRAEDRSGFGKDKIRRHFLSSVRTISLVVLLFAHVEDVQSCADMPISIKSSISGLIRDIEGACEENPEVIELDAIQVFHDICALLSGGDQHHEEATKGPRKTFQNLHLFSDFDWSVYLPVIGDKDPADIKTQLVLIKNGTPISLRTKEQKRRLVDGIGFCKTPYPQSWPVSRASLLRPCMAAAVQERKELWTSRPREFEMTFWYNIRPSSEWLDLMGSRQVQAFEEMAGYRSMHECLWLAHRTPESACPGKHPAKRKMKLAPEAATVLGYAYGADEDDENDLPDKVIVLMTAGNRHLRWLAIIENTAVPQRKSSGRQVMLRTPSCCEECAVSYTCSLQGKWVVVL